MRLNEKLVQMKTENGLTTDALSLKSGVPKGTINKILNGETRNPTVATLAALARNIPWQSRTEMHGTRVTAAEIRGADAIFLFKGSGKTADGVEPRLKGDARHQITGFQLFPRLLQPAAADIIPHGAAAADGKDMTKMMEGIAAVFGELPEGEVLLKVFLNITETALHHFGVCDHRFRLPRGGRSKAFFLPALSQNIPPRCAQRAG